MDKAYWDKLAIRYDRRSMKYNRMYNRLITLLKMELSKNDIVIDIGTGTGEIPILLSSAVREFQGIDSSDSMIDVAKEKTLKSKVSNVFFSVQDSCNLQVNDRKFDIVIIANLLHIVDNPQKVIMEAKRVLRDDGKLIVATYLHGHSIETRILSCFLKLQRHPIYTRFDEKSMADLLNSNGFVTTKQELIDNLIPVSFIVTQKKIEKACLVDVG